MRYIAILVLAMLVSNVLAAPKEVAKLIDQLGAGTFKERQAAEEALKKQSRSILPLLKEFENSRDPEIKARVRRIIQCIAPTFEGFIGKRAVTINIVIEFLNKAGIKYKNLQVRRGHFYLDIRGTGIKDLYPLKGMPITQLYYTPGSGLQGLEVIKEMRTLQTINGRQPLDHWNQENNANKAIDHYGLEEMIRAAPPARRAGAPVVEPVEIEVQVEPVKR